MTGADVVHGPVLAVEGLSVEVARRDGAVALIEDVSFSLEAGRTLGLVGESGSGKSLTAMSILGLHAPPLRISAGAVHFEGADLLGLAPRALRRVRGNRIGMIFQDPQNSLDPTFTVGRQLVETIRTHTSMSGRAAHDLAVSLLDRVGIPQPARRARDYPHQLSGGMAQRVMIAMAICCQPRVLIADEPTTALDVTVQAQILSLLRSLQDELGMALLLISHDLSVIAEMADDVAVMYAGNIVEQGAVEPTFDRPSHPYTEALLGAHPGASVKGEALIAIPGMVPNPDRMPAGCRFHPRCSYAESACRDHEPTFVLTDADGARGDRCMRRGALELRGVQRAHDRVGAETTTPSSERAALVEVRGLTKEYPLRGGFLGRGGSTLVAVDDVTMVVHEGETLGVVGESGAGKSTVGRMVLGLDEPTSGSVLFRGTDMTAIRGAERHRMRRDVQAVFQNPYASLDPTMTIGDSIAEPLQVHLDLGRAEERARVGELLGQVGLSRSAIDRYPHALSGGQRQRVAIARALALNPRLLVCDEPVSALDVSTQAQVINLLRDLQQQLGLAYLFIGHDLSVVYQISDRVAVMYHGRVVETGPSAAVYRHPHHPYTQMLLSAVLSIDPHHRRLASVMAGQVSTNRASTGCPFAPRCPVAMEQCWTETPPAATTPEGATSWCHLPLDEQHRAVPGGAPAPPAEVRLRAPLGPHAR